MSLRRACSAAGIIWSAVTLDQESVTWHDPTHVAHGAVVIGYVPPRDLRAGAAAAVLTSARAQVQRRVLDRSAAEGRHLDHYLLAVWDGTHIAFGCHQATAFVWEPLVEFGVSAALRLLRRLRDDGLPLVHPALLVETVGAESALGQRLVSQFRAAVRAAHRGGVPSTRTASLYRAWCRHCGHGAGHGSVSAPGRPCSDEHLYALNTYVALVAKLVAALSLPSFAPRLTDPGIPLRERIGQLESDVPFTRSGALGLLSTDFFGWYHEDQAWAQYEADVEALVDALRPMDLDVGKKTPESTRDLFKSLYLSFVPGAQRHALGEYYTPDWLAAHAFDVVGWNPDDDLLDPTAGSGTFVLEALRRRLEAWPRASAADLLAGLGGLDLNPLAVLTARASVVVCLARRLDPATPVRLPVFLADAINSATLTDGDTYEHCLPTELGVVTVRLPARFVHGDQFFDAMARIADLLDSGADSRLVVTTLTREYTLESLDSPGREHLAATVEALAELRRRTGHTTWCAVLADGVAAAAVPPADHVIGNPPWVRWSRLPAEHARIVRKRCRELGVFSDDRWVGGIESDISTVVTYAAVEKYLADRGVLAFFITGTVFANESGQGFRRWGCPRTATPLRVTLVEDYAAIAPFDGVRNHPTLLVLTRGLPTDYPVTYRIWTPPEENTARRDAKHGFANAGQFRAVSTSVDLEARPVPGTDAGPWLKGTAAQHRVWAHLFGSQKPAYRARKGATTDANGIFWVRAKRGRRPGTVTIANDPGCGRRREIRAVHRTVESEHLYPLLRGAAVRAFRATPDPTYRILVPQRGMHGLPDLPETAPRTAMFLATFRQVLEQRSSFRRFQARQGAPFWSLWSVGEYTFSPFKVVWRELGGGRFQAAYVGSHDDEILGTKVVVPDHKLYFVPCAEEDEAAYLVGFLNAPLVTEAISAYAAQLSLGASVVEYLLVPKYEPSDPAHAELAAVARQLTRSPGIPPAERIRALDHLVAAVLTTAIHSDR